MLLALAIFFAATVTAAGIGQFLLHLPFRSEPIDLSNDSRHCYENWAAHRACPQGLPAVDA